MLKAEIENGELVLRLPLESPRPSKSGKMLLVGTTGGFTSTEAKVNEKNLRVNLTAGIYAN